jgi:hypothetical protein
LCLAAFRPAKPRRRWCKQIRCAVVSSIGILALLGFFSNSESRSS